MRRMTILILAGWVVVSTGASGIAGEPPESSEACEAPGEMMGHSEPGVGGVLVTDGYFPTAGVSHFWDLNEVEAGQPIAALVQRPSGAPVSLSLHLLAGDECEPAMVEGYPYNGLAVEPIVDGRYVVEIHAEGPFGGQYTMELILGPAV